MLSLITQPPTQFNKVRDREGQRIKVKMQTEIARSIHCNGICAYDSVGVYVSPVTLCYSGHL